jgi:hypothetical protein
LFSQTLFISHFSLILISLLTCFGLGSLSMELRKNSNHWHVHKQFRLKVIVVGAFDRLPINCRSLNCHVSQILNFLFTSQNKRPSTNCEFHLLSSHTLHCHSLNKPPNHRCLYRFICPLKKVLSVTFRGNNRFHLPQHFHVRFCFHPLSDSIRSEVQPFPSNFDSFLFGTQPRLRLRFPFWQVYIAWSERYSRSWGRICLTRKDRWRFERESRALKNDSWRERSWKLRVWSRMIVSLLFEVLRGWWRIQSFRKERFERERIQSKSVITIGLYQHVQSFISRGILS